MVKLMFRTRDASAIDTGCSDGVTPLFCPVPRPPIHRRSHGRTARTLLTVPAQFLFPFPPPVGVT